MRAIKKMTQNDIGPGRNYGKKAAFMFSKKGYYFSHNFAWAWPGLGVVFLGLKSRFLAQKSNFCHTTPNFVNDPFVALGETAHFQPSEQFFDFLFRVTAVSVKKKKQPMRQKVFPCPTLGAPSASNSPSALSRPFELENFASICSVTVV